SLLISFARREHSFCTSRTLKKVAGGSAKERQKFPPFERVGGGWDEQPDSKTKERCGWCIHRFRCAFRMDGSSLIPSHDDRSIAFPCTRESMALAPPIHGKRFRQTVFDIRERIQLQDIT